MSFNKQGISKPDGQRSSLDKGRQAYDAISTYLSMAVDNGDENFNDQNDEFQSERKFDDSINFANYNETHFGEENSNSQGFEESMFHSALDFPELSHDFLSPSTFLITSNTEKKQQSNSSHSNNYISNLRVLLYDGRVLYLHGVNPNVHRVFDIKMMICDKLNQNNPNLSGQLSPKNIEVNVQGSVMMDDWLAIDCGVSSNSVSTIQANIKIQPNDRDIPFEEENYGKITPFRFALMSGSRINNNISPTKSSMLSQQSLDHSDSYMNNENWDKRGIGSAEEQDAFRTKKSSFSREEIEQHKSIVVMDEKKKIEKRVTPEEWESRVRPEEREFHDILRSTFGSFKFETKSGTDFGFGDTEMDESEKNLWPLQKYSEICQNRYQELSSSIQKAREISGSQRPYFSPQSVPGSPMHNPPLPFSPLSRFKSDSSIQPFFDTNESIQYSMLLLMREEILSTLMKQERDTWQLLYRLCDAGFFPKLSEDCEKDTSNLSKKENKRKFPETVTSLDISASDIEVKEALIDGDDSYRKMLCILNWLEDCATDKIVSFQIGTTMWPATNARLNKTKPNLSTKGVSGLDPDASFRITAEQKNNLYSGDFETKQLMYIPLDDVDEEDEHQLMLSIWTMLRAGQINRAIELCIENGHAWRAASFAGGMLSEEAEDFDINGNPRRILWKLSCWEFGRLSYASSTSNKNSSSKVSKVAEVEAAIYALFANDLKTLLESPLCQSWEDRCWALFKSATEKRLDEALHHHHQRQKKSSSLLQYPAMSAMSSFNHEQEYLNRVLKGTILLNEASILETLQKTKFHELQPTSKFYECQISLILGQFQLQEFICQSILPTLLENHTETRQNATELLVPKQLTRFSAHFIIFLLQNCPELLTPVHADFNARATCYDVITAYIHHLSRHQQIKLVPIYASFLPQSLRIDVFVKFLQGIQNPDDQKMSLFAANDYFPEDYAEIARKVAESARNEIDSDKSILKEKNLSIFDTFDPLIGHKALEDEGVSRIDLQKIQSIQWVCYDISHRTQALVQSNTLIREFLSIGDQMQPATNKLRAVQVLIEQHLPSNCVDDIKNNKEIQTVQGLVQEIAIREHECWKLFINAHKSYSNWRLCRVHCVPRPPPEVPKETQEQINPRDGINFIRKVQAHAIEVEQLTEKMIASVQRAVMDLYNVILFEDGWLTFADFNFGDVEQIFHENWFEEILKLRKICLAQTLFMLFNVLFETGQWSLSFNIPKDQESALNWFRQSLELANIVADEGLQLYQILSPNNLEHFLTLIQTSAMRILSLGGDI